MLQFMVKSEKSEFELSHKKIRHTYHSFAKIPPSSDLDDNPTLLYENSTLY